MLRCPNLPLYLCALFKPQNTAKAPSVEVAYMITLPLNGMTVRKGYGNFPSFIVAQCSTQAL